VRDTATSLPTLSLAPLAISIAAGLGNALFHLGGGLDTLNDSSRRAAALGVFVSPGALGLFIGTLWGKGSAVPLLLAPAGSLLLTAAILILARRTYGSFSSENAPYDPTPKGSIISLSPLFLVVVLRSWMGMSQAFPWKADFAVILTVSLMLGKMAGGFLSDRLGRNTASAASLLPADLLYLLSALPLPGILAVFLFNMTMPITLHAAAEQLPGAKGFSFGLLTFALFLGFLPSALGWPSPFASPIGCAAAAILSLLLLLWGLGKGEVGC
jgi:FSR family fosmidomycin resistance protein-like MFS transporter